MMMELTLTQNATTSAGPWPIFLAYLRMSLSYFRRNGISLVMTLALPVLFLVLYSYSYFLNAPTMRISISIAESVPQHYAERLAKTLDDSLFTLKTVPDAALDKSINDGKARLALRLDPHSQQLIVHTSKYDRAWSDLLLQALSAPSDANQRALREQHIKLVGEEGGPRAFLPGVILMSLLNLGLFTTGAKILQERASGTLRLYRMLPAPMWLYFAAELVSKLLLASVLILLFLVAANLLVDLPLTVSGVLQTLLAGLCCATAFIALGIAIGCSLGRYSSGIHVFTVVNLLLLFLGDMFFAASKYTLTKMIAMSLPTTYSADILKSLMLDLPQRFPYWASFGFLALFSLLAFAIASLNFRYTAKD